MASEAAFSVTANACAIVGLADVVYRSGKHLHDLYSRIQNAHASVAQLLEEMRLSISMVAHARIYLHESEAASSAAEAAQCLPQIRTILTLLGQEFDVLAKIIVDVQTLPSEGWLGKLVRNVRWAVGDERVAQPCLRLQRLTASMTSALSVIGRRNDIVVRRELSATRADLLRLEKQVQRHMGTITLAQRSLQTRPRPTRQCASYRRIRIQGQNLQLERRNTGFQGGTVLESDSEGGLSDNLILPAMTATKYEDIRLWENDDGAIYLAGPIHNEITMPLLLLKATLSSAVHAAQATASLFTLSGHIKRTDQIIAYLLAYSHILSAARIHAEGCNDLKALSFWNASATHDQDSGQTSHLTPRKDSLVVPGSVSSRRRGIRNPPSLYITRRTEQRTPSGALTAEVVIGGDSGNSEVEMGSQKFASAAIEGL
ncbi:uncharacterized protein DNG_07539 [Cephalotrichum gorgonifer]|uniref:Fungal N-terminal domain-containing protein n=1 Tax=Cephalotrichum gorgonifer TaxID=2041049 RepID=A0AAE8N3L3_9PEZI|nr:uncharacterized protein DNG_07539 [Cephalotrichum gorgonifer]